MGCALWLSRQRLSRAAELTLLSLASLFFLKHLIYDYVFLAVPLGYALAMRQARARNPIFAGVFVFWALAGVLNRAATDLAVHLASLTLNVLLMAAFVAYTTLAVKRAEGQAAGAAELSPAFVQSA